VALEKENSEETMYTPTSLRIETKNCLVKRESGKGIVRGGKIRHGADSQKMPLGPGRWILRENENRDLI